MTLSHLRTAILALGCGAAVLGSVQAVHAAKIAAEQAVNGTAQVTLYLHSFLTAEELATLRVVSSNPQALELFVKSNKGYAALAAAPEEGVFRNGKPVASAIALTDLPDRATAQANALKACEAAKTTASACVVILDVVPQN